MGLTSRNPPAVQYPVRRSRTLALLLCAVASSGAGSISVWAASGLGAGSGTSWRLVGAVAVGVLAVAGAIHFWWNQWEGILHWDGQAWWLEDRGPGVASMSLLQGPQALLDVQSHLWVHVVVQEGRGRIWLWLERSAQPEHWQDLRRAVYSRARPGVGHTDATAPAPNRGRES